MSMNITYNVEIKCSNCGKHIYYQGIKSQGEAEQKARNLGWSTMSRCILCPECYNREDAQELEAWWKAFLQTYLDSNLQHVSIPIKYFQEIMGCLEFKNTRLGDITYDKDPLVGKPNVYLRFCSQEEYLIHRNNMLKELRATLEETGVKVDDEIYKAYLGKCDLGGEHLER